MIDSSLWKKWDLHVHTPASFENNYSFKDEVEEKFFSGNIWEKYVYELGKIKDISVIGITDYFTIEGYIKILQYKEEGKLKNFDLILPNIELRLDILSSKNKRLNFHIIFSDEIDPYEIKEHFLHSLEFQTGKGESRRLTQKNIEEIGQLLKKENNNFKGSSYQIGCKNITINIDNILETLDKNKSKFFNKYLLVLSASEWDDIGWNGQGHIIKKHSLFRSHAVFSSNLGTINFCLGKKHSSTEEFTKEFGSIKPCIHGSDAHSFDELCKPDENRYCWIKAIPTFDGLKQIIYEPEDRVKIQRDSPEFYKSIYSIKSINFFDTEINDEISLNRQKINLNKNFVAITGGKGSGKTAILDLIANCYLDRCLRNDDENVIGEDKNSFVQRIQNGGEKLGIIINFIDSSIEPFSKKLVERIFIEKSPITYLPQGKIEEISGNKIKLNEKIQQIIFNNEEIKKCNYKESFFEIEEKKDNLSKDLYELNNQISNIEGDTTKEIIATLNRQKQIYEGKLADIKSQIQRIEVNLEEDIQKKISDLKIGTNKIKFDDLQCNEIITEINFLKGKIDNFVYTSNKSILSINNRIEENGEENRKLFIPNIDLKEQISALSSIEITYNKKREILRKELSIKEKMLIGLSGEEKTHLILLKEMEHIENDLNKISDKQNILNSKKNTIKQLEIKRNEVYNKFLTTLKNWKEFYEKIILVFSDGKNDILGDIDFKSKILFDYDAFFSIGNDIINKKKINPEELEIRINNLESALYDFFEENISYDNIFAAITYFLGENVTIKKNRSNREFYDWLFGNFFKLITEIEFKGTSIDKLSMGQKGTVLLKLFLAEGNYPIILDQPEENLDNKFIYNELVGAMRNAKNNRQVIIATNNANLVVNTDADQIIIAEFNQGRISYKSGALESPEIRQEIMPLLEGGPEAFKRREQKYGILGYNL